MPLANSYRTMESTSSEVHYPLQLARCPSCGLVQITETVPPEVLFRDYLYFSGFSVAMGVHAQQLVQRTCVQRQLDKHSLVVELASNDGYLLKHYLKAGVPVLGIEPARNIAAVAEQHGIRTIAEFFGADLAASLTGQGFRADVIHANNVLAHVADLPGFVRGIRMLLKEDGVALIEFPHVLELLRHLEFDTIYHEHLYYFSLHALTSLLARHDLGVLRVEKLPLHGGSLLVHVGVLPLQPDSTVAAVLEEERSEGLNDGHRYTDFADQVLALRGAVHQFAAELRADGKRVAAYGAAAKGTVLLNACGLDEHLLDFVVDRSPYKQGRWMPGSRIPILPPEALL
jgi:SAM-dependent methyltransferase